MPERSRIRVIQADQGGKKIMRKIDKHRWISKELRQSRAFNVEHQSPKEADTFPLSKKEKTLKMLCEQHAACTLLHVTAYKNEGIHRDTQKNLNRLESVRKPNMDKELVNWQERKGQGKYIF